MLKYMSVVVIVCMVVPGVRFEDKPEYAKLIVGNWAVTKGDPGSPPEGTMLEFTKDRKLKATFKEENKKPL